MSVDAVVDDTVAPAVQALTVLQSALNIGGRVVDGITVEVPVGHTVLWEFNVEGHDFDIDFRLKVGETNSAPSID